MKMKNCRSSHTKKQNVVLRAKAAYDSTEQAFFCFRIDFALIMVIDHLSTFFFLHFCPINKFKYALNSLSFLK